MNNETKETEQLVARIEQMTPEQLEARAKELERIHIANLGEDVEG